MFFFLSKTLSYITLPLVIIVLCFLLYAVLRKIKWRKWLFRIGLGLLLFLTNDFIANEVFRAWELPAVPFKKINKQYEYGILLTGVTKSQAEPSDRVHFGRGADRVTHTVQLYKSGYIKKILVSGGSGRLVDIGEREADVIASALILMGVPDEDILREGDSRNTHESALAVKKMLEGKYTADQCILITSGYHMRRSRACYVKAGWKTDTFNADIVSHKRQFTFDSLLVPGLGALEMWQTLIREWVGMIAYKLAGYI